jgi:hypothetical protein
MEHIKDIELIELAAGRLDIEREQVVLLHLAGCSACSGKLAGIRQTWDVLGTWEVRPPQCLDSERIGKLAVTADREATGRTVRFPAAGMLLRVAASIVVVALLGYGGGRWSFGPVQTSVSSPLPSYVSALGLEVGETLSLLVLDDESGAGEAR